MGQMQWLRQGNQPTRYPENRNPVWADLNHVAIIFACTVLAAALLMIVLGTRGKERWSTFIRITFSLHVGVVILVTLYGQAWQSSYVETVCEYLASPRELVSARISVLIGLRSVNMTLTGFVSNSGSIDYNERFHWYKARYFQKEYHNALERGLPVPLLYLAEYFTIDSGGLRWSRIFKEAGYFVYILLWSSFVAWMMCNVMLCFVIVRGALLLSLSGLGMLGSCAMYHCLQPSHPLVVPFPDARLNLHYGWCFWLCGASGILTMVVGLSVLLLYYLFPLHVSIFFLSDTSYLEEDSTIQLPSGKPDMDPSHTRVNIAGSHETGEYHFNQAFTGDDVLERVHKNSKIRELV